MKLLVEEIKSRVTVSDVDKLIYGFGGFKTIETDEYAVYTTVCHNHDGTGSQKLYFYKSSKGFYCYSNCGSFDIIGLIEHALDIEFKQALAYLSKFFNISSSLTPFGFGDRAPVEFDDAKYINHNEVEEVILPVINKYVLDIFIDYHCCEWLSEGISHETMNKYLIKYFLDQHKIVIPHHNADGELVGIRGRALLKEDLDKGQKYMPIFIGKKGYTHSLMHNLYGLNFNKEAIQKYRKVIIFEGEKSVLLMDTIYGDSNCSVAVCGSKIHKSHAKMLLELGVEEVVVAFDKQYENIEDKVVWEKKIFKSLQFLLPFCKVSVIWDKIENGVLEYRDSPVDRGKHIFEMLLKNREVILI